MKTYYDDYPNHHFPPHRWNPQINDTEVAHVTAPWKDCCDKDEDCVCVTEEDVARWDTISSLSALTGVDFDELSSYSAVAASADLWNNNYETVSSNSSYWNGVSGLDQLSSNLSASAAWQSATDIVSSHSAQWNSAFKYHYQVDENTSAIDALSSLFEHNVRAYPDNKTITGDGTSGNPFAVVNYDNIVKLINYCVSAIKPLYTMSSSGGSTETVQNWMSLDATTDSDGINPYLKTLFNAINKKDNDQDVTLNNHGELIQWLINNLNKHETTGSDLLWTNIPTPTVKSELEQYKNKDTIYYSYTN